MSTRLLIVTFHEIAIKYDSELKTQLVLLDISKNPNVESQRSLHFKFRQMIYLFKMIYHVMKDFHLCSWLPSYDLSKISAKLAISLKHKISFAEFLDILFDNSVTSSLRSLKKKKNLHTFR